MIEYEIVVNHRHDQKLSPAKVTPRDANYKEVVFQRQLKVCKYEPGQYVKVRKSAKRGQILEIIEDINQVNWLHNRPQFVKVDFGKDGVMMCNPSQLKRRNP